MYLRPDAIPRPNQISRKAAQKWAARIAPPGEARDLLAEMLLCMGIQADISGAEWAILRFISYAPYRNSQACAEVREEAKRLLREYILSSGSECSETSKNRLIDFYLRFYEARMYPQLARLLHIGVVGKFEQVIKDKKTLKAMDTAINNFMSAIRVVLPYLHPSELPDLGCLENPGCEIELKFVEELEAALRRVIAPIPKQRRTNGSYRYPEESVYKIAKSFVNALLDLSRHKKYITRETGSRQSSENSTDPQGSYPSKKSTIDKPTRESAAELSFIEKLDAVEPGPVESYYVAARQKEESKGQNQRSTFLDWTIGYPEKISYRVLALLYHIMDQSTFLADRLNRIGAQIIVDNLLHYRRGPEFTGALRLGEKSNVIYGPVLSLSEGVIYTLPRYYFGKNEKEINTRGQEYYLEDQGRYADWQAQLEGREYGDLVSALPLTALHTQRWESYLEQLRIAGVDTEDGEPLLRWRRANQRMVPFNAAHLKIILEELSEVLQSKISDYPSLTQTRIKNSFDTYYWLFGLSLPGYWHISETSRSIVEMPTRYTVLNVKRLAEMFFSAHNRLLIELMRHAPYPIDLPLSSPSSLEKLPDHRMGGWRAIDKANVLKLVEFFRGAGATKLTPRGRTRAQRVHNRAVWQVTFLLGLMNGLRNMEPGRLRPEHFSSDKQSLLLRGKGNYFRELPLHPMVSKLLERLAKKGGEWLLWVYDENGEPTPLTSELVDGFIHQACKLLGLPHLDYYGLRPRFRSDMADLGMPDVILNYLMGHKKEGIRNFALKALDANVRQAYDHFIEILMERYQIFRLEV